MRFCTTCQSKQEEEGGYKIPGSMRGWRCKKCKDRETPSIYKAKKTADKAAIDRLMTLIYGDDDVYTVLESVSKKGKKERQRKGV